MLRFWRLFKNASNDFKMCLNYKIYKDKYILYRHWRNTLHRKSCVDYVYFSKMLNLFLNLFKS